MKKVSVEERIAEVDRILKLYDKSIYHDDGSVKSFYDLLEMLSDLWDEINDGDKEDIKDTILYSVED